MTITVQVGDDYLLGVALLDSSGNHVGNTSATLPVGFGDSPSLDAFSRLRTSSPHVLFNGQQHYGQKHHLFVETLTSGGTLTDSPVDSSLTHTVTSTTGSKVRNASRRHMYQAGLSQMIACTFNFGVSGDAELVTRTSTSGSTVDTVIAQADWNKDPMDGTGASGITVDWTKTQILLIDLQWLGVGRVRFYLDIDGIAYEIHHMKNANSQTQVYIQTANLPVCYETEKTTTGINRSAGYYDADDGVFLRQKETTATGGTFMQICASVFSEGATQPLGLKRYISNQGTSITAANGVLTPILSIRPAALFKTRSNKSSAVPLKFELFVVSGTIPVHFEILEDATLTGASWAAVNATDSMMEYDLTASAVSGGQARGGGFVEAVRKGGAGEDISAVNTAFDMQIDPDGVPDTLTIAAMGIGGTAPVIADIEWSERY